jgi:hypothetical protein
MRRLSRYQAVVPGVIPHSSSSLDRSSSDTDPNPTDDQERTPIAITIAVAVMAAACVELDGSKGLMTLRVG